MKILPVPTTNFCEFTCNESLVQEVLNEVKQLKFKPNDLNNISVTDYFNKNLFDWFDDCLGQLKTHLLLKPNINLAITTCWVNKNTQIQKHFKHSHPNSFASAVFYLTSHESSYTQFFYKNDWFSGTQIVPFNGTVFPENIFKIKPESGKLVIFPGNSIHDVSPLKKGEEDRYTVSFNVFCDGVISDRMTDTLEIKVKSVREKFLT